MASEDVTKVFCPSTGKTCAFSPGCGKVGSEWSWVCTGDYSSPLTSDPVQDFSGSVDGKGYKRSMDDPTKTPLSLVPEALILACGRALGHGAKKYAPNNWRRGMAFSEVFSALQRHLLAWNEGRNLDDDSGLNHLDHAAACLSFLCEYSSNSEYHKFDDRPNTSEENNPL